VWKSLGFHGLHDEIRDRREVVRLGMEGPAISMSLFVRLEPGFGVEGLGLELSAGDLVEGS
jgi:hypothetical protein